MKDYLKIIKVSFTYLWHFLVLYIEKKVLTFLATHTLTSHDKLINFIRPSLIII